MFGNKMCNILHYRITLWYTKPIITSKCAIYYTFHVPEVPTPTEFVWQLPHNIPQDAPVKISLTKF